MSIPSTMQAMVYGGPGRKSWTSAPAPKISQPTDAVVKIVKTTICGTDLHIAQWTPGYESMKEVMPVTLGHEFAGVVVEVGSEVRHWRPGDRVTMPFVAGCGRCCTTSDPTAAPVGRRRNAAGSGCCRRICARCWTRWSGRPKPADR